jgi:hypothetical protein
VLDGAELEKVKVEAVVAEHVKGRKIRVFKYRPKKRYRRRAGHRSLLTRLEISDIKGPAARTRQPATKKETTKETGAAEGEKKAPARKAPARKPRKEG